MDEQLIGFNTAVLAKEKGFPIQDAMSYYDKNGDFHPFSSAYVFRNIYDSEASTVKKRIEKEYSEYYGAPTQSLLQKWLRDIHRIDVHCECDYEREKWKFGYRKKGYSYNHYPLEYDSYEDALDIGLQEALKLVKG